MWPHACAACGDRARVSCATCTSSRNNGFMLGAVPVLAAGISQFRLLHAASVGDQDFVRSETHLFIVFADHLIQRIGRRRFHRGRLRRCGCIPPWEAGFRDRCHFRCGGHDDADGPASQPLHLLFALAAHCLSSARSLPVRPTFTARTSATYLAIWRLIHARRQDRSPPSRRNLLATHAGPYIGSCCHSHQHLAEVLALQHAEERCGRVLEPVDDILAILDATGAHPFADIAQEIAFSGCEIEDDEPA